MALNLSSAAEPGHSSFSPSALSGAGHGIEMAVQVLGVGRDVEKPGDDLPLGRVLMQEAHGGEPVVHVIVGVELAQERASSRRAASTSSTLPGS